MLRDVLVFSNDFQIESLHALAEELDWELEHIYPSRVTSHGGFVWLTPDNIRVHYIENKRFYVRYLILGDEHQDTPLFKQLMKSLPILDLTELFRTIEYETDDIKRIEALHKSSALVSPKDKDDAYAEMLRRLLTSDQVSDLMRMATLQLCEELAWDELMPWIEQLAYEEWLGMDMAKRVFRACQ